jgi:hypothetical protein
MKRAMLSKGQYLRHVARKFITAADRPKKKGAKIAPFRMSLLVGSDQNSFKKMK